MKKEQIIDRLNDYIVFIDGLIADCKPDEAMKKADYIKTMAALLHTRVISTEPTPQPVIPSSTGGSQRGGANSLTRQQAEDMDGQTCPKCGIGTMTIKTAKKGERAGKTFIGCSNWQGGCKNTINIEG